VGHTIQPLGTCTAATWGELHEPVGGRGGAVEAFSLTFYGIRHGWVHGITRIFFAIYFYFLASLPFFFCVFELGLHPLFLLHWPAYMFWVVRGHRLPTGGVLTMPPRGHIRNAYGRHRYLVCRSRAYRDGRQGF